LSAERPWQLVGAAPQRPGLLHSAALRTSPLLRGGGVFSERLCHLFEHPAKYNDKAVKNTRPTVLASGAGFLAQYAQQRISASPQARQA